MPAAGAPVVRGAAAGRPADRTTARITEAGLLGPVGGVGLIAIILAVIALFILLTVGIDLWTDALWFTSIGFDAVFWTRIGATLGLFAATFLIASVILLGNLWLAARLSPPPDADHAGSFRSLIDRMNDAAQAADMRRDRPGGMYRMRGTDGPQAPVVTFDTGDLPDLTPLAGGVLVVLSLLIALAVQARTAAGLPTPARSTCGHGWRSCPGGRGP